MEIQASGDSTGAREFALSDTGSLVYVPGTVAAGTVLRPLVWVDRQGHEQPIAAKPREYQSPRLSPDGARLVVSAKAGDKEQDLWVWDLAHETLTRLTFGPDQANSAAWTSDGRHVIFSSQTAGGPTQILRIAADGTGTPEKLLASDVGANTHGVSPDGKFLVYGAANKGTGQDLMVLPLDGHGQPRPLIQTKFYEANAAISPDGRWIAYQSIESGRVEIYVRPFPKVDAGRWLISADGAWDPMWTRSGRELVFRDSNATHLMSVAIQPGDRFEFDKPKLLFDITPYYANGSNYDISADGKKFLMIKNAQAAGPTEHPSLTIVTHWIDELRARVK